MLVECRRTLVDVDCQPTRVARSGCAQGKHRAKTLMNLVDDWVCRTICPCWHVPLGTAQGFHDATAWLREGILWVHKEAQFAWSRHALAGSTPR